MARINGTSVVTGLAYMRARWGEEGLKRIRAAMRPEDIDHVFNPAISSLSWVEWQPVINCTMVADQLFGKGDRELLVDIGREAAKRQLSTIYKLMVAMAKPGTILNRAPGYWRRFHDRGEFSFKWAGHNHGVSTLVEFPDIPLHHELGHYGWTEELFRRTGVTGLSMEHPSCIARGDEECIVHYRW